MQKILVYFGGISNEHEISVITGVMALNLMDRSLFDPVPLYASTDGKLYTSEKMRDIRSFRRGTENFERVVWEGDSLYTLRKNKLKFFCKADCVLNCAHGGIAEGGGVAALCEMHSVPCASCPVAPSAVCLDKVLTKIVAKGLDIRTVPYLYVQEDDDKKRVFLYKLIEEKLGYPVICKPAKLGSSIGIFAANNREELEKGLSGAFTYDKCVLVEKRLENCREINCAAYGKDGKIVLSECEECNEKGGIFTFADKYLQNGTHGKIPADLSEMLTRKIKGYTKSLYKHLGMSGVVRADFLIADGEVYFSEMNTVPGSLAYYLFGERLSDFSALVTALIQEGIRRFNADRKKCFSTGILYDRIVSQK